MKHFAHGKHGEFINVLGNPLYPGYLIRGKERSLMIDAGINLFGPLYLQSLDNLPGESRNLDLLFLTHSHYDHLGAAPYLRRKIPSLKIGAHERIAELMRKTSVIASMNELSEVQREAFKDITGNEDVSIAPIVLDYKLKEGDTFDLGGLTCEVYETPGHTRDSLSYYFPEIGTLFPGEAAGVPEGYNSDEIQVEFLSSYPDYTDSIRKLIHLDVKMICLGHGWIFTDGDAKKFLDKSLSATEIYKNLIDSYLEDSNGNIEDAIDAMIKKEYDEKGTIGQERSAYITNLRAQVRLVAAMG